MFPTLRKWLGVALPMLSRDDGSYRVTFARRPQFKVRLFFWWTAVDGVPGPLGYRTAGSQPGRRIIQQWVCGGHTPLWVELNSYRTWGPPLPAGTQCINIYPVVSAFPTASVASVMITGRSRFKLGHPAGQSRWKIIAYEFRSQFAPRFQTLRESELTTRTSSD